MTTRKIYNKKIILPNINVFVEKEYYIIYGYILFPPEYI